MSDFIIDGKKLMAADDVDGEVWLRGRDVIEVLKSTKRDSKELQDWISDQVMHFAEKSNDILSLNRSDKVSQLEREIEQKNEEIAENNRRITKLKETIAAMQKQLSQTGSEFSGTYTSDKENCTLLFLVKKNLEKIENDMDYFPYYALITKKRSETESLERLKSEYPLSEIMLRVEDPPKTDILYRLTELKKINSCENHLRTNLTEEELISLFADFKFSNQY